MMPFQGFNRNSYWDDLGLDSEPKKPAPLDSFWVKSVNPGGSAANAGLAQGEEN